MEWFDQRSDDGRELNEAFPYNDFPVPHNPRTKTGLGVSPGFSDPYASCSGFDYSMASNAGCGELRLTDRNYTRFFQQSALGSSSSVVDLKEVFGSPSSVMTSSGGDSCSDKAQSNVGAVYAQSGFSEPTRDCIKHRELVESNPNFDHVGAQSFPVSNMRLDKYNAWYPQQIASLVPKDANNLSSMLLSKPKSTHEGFSQSGHQIPQPRQCHLQPCHPPPNSDVSLRAQVYGSVGQQRFYNEVQRERSIRLPQPSVDQLQRFQQQRFCTGQAPKRSGEIQDAQDILISYFRYKSKPMFACGGQQGFVAHLHLRLCNGRQCECEKYHFLVSHFENCHNTDCQICEPVRQSRKNINSTPVFKSCPGIRINSGVEEPKGYFRPRDYNIEGVQPTHKRMKMDNAVPHDGWSLGDIVLPFLRRSIGGVTDDKGISMNTNNELLRSKEAPTTDGSRNDTADYGGKTDDGLVGLAKSSEDPTNWPTLDKESPSSIGDFGKSLPSTNVFDNKELKTDYAFCRSEELNLVDKQKEKRGDSISKIKSDSTSSCRSLTSDGISVLSEEPPFSQAEKIKLISEAGDGERDAKCDSSTSTSDCKSGSDLEGLKDLGVSAIDSFTAEQIKEHLHSLNQSMNLNVEKELTRNTSDHTVAEGTCQLCAGGQLMFTAPPMYCTCCGRPIKRMSTYYSEKDEMGTRSCFCISCFRKFRSGNISLRGGSFSKAKLDKCKNIEENEEEGWVQCDKCECWQHQVCGLYNSIRDLGGKGYYICPLCRLAEREAIEHVSTPPAFGAQDLPRTMLSDHIEQRLFSNLERERKQRANLEGRSPEEVPGAEDLTVRVVLAIDKQLKVKQQFLDILHGETYPTEFPYKSKVILLFQKIEGVDVCLFAMYVQEYGSECGHPNKRSVYISYLDSVKHFRPEIRSVGGVALRTFVYHEILIGYLDYCKRRGFTTCYIWACPPLKGQDYILHCHPETQKRPLSAKLLQWYKKMLKKAVEENVVVECTNLYDYFFVPSEVCNSKVTAARLPCFDGDYWSGAIEDTLQTIENKNGGESERKVKNMTNRTLRLMGHTNLSVDATKDVLVMQKIPVNDVAADTDDKDVLLDNEIIENRYSFLSFCEKNHYQFDTLRRAKYSSMMILHHLHKTTALTVRTKSECITKSMQMQQQRASEVKALLDLLDHANQCEATRDHPCSYSKCFHLKKLFRHSRECKSRVDGGCNNCKKIWSLLRLHARNCSDSNCNFPRCMDIKNHKEKLATQSEVQRRAAVTIVDRERSV
ncbi:hypothetical protein BUALT_Bualt04G0127500 [Buddleja alternifolia]|uniref:histone acetyltransferase n=1 Tax=Buddleja alternifolia TaxID=168488 RepID=A0AAV6XSV4_9LAMI|nr:hypothetical protein BUALT_Bualt04G0127500 [Buddleja alternifolia]